MWSFLVRFHAQASSTVFATAVTTVSAASYSPDAIAPESIVAAFGSGLATATAVAVGDADPNTPGIQLPTELAGVSVEVNNRKAGLFFVSPNQINYLIPAATEIGSASVTVKAGSTVVAAGTAQVRQTGPAIFTANSDGKGVPAAYALRVKADGTQSTEAIAKYDSTSGSFFTQPLSLGPAGERVFLVLFASGLRYAADPNRDGNVSESVRVILGGSEIIPAYAGRQGSLVGLDQLNVELPRALLGQGFLSLSITVSGATDSNTAEIELLVPAGTGPVAGDLTVVTDEDAAKTVTLSGSDLNSRALSWRIVNQPAHGTLSGTAPNLTYTPAKDYNGGDSFRYVVSNGAQTSNAANAFIAIRSVNDPPVLTVPGAQSVSSGQRLTFLVSARDIDAGDTISFSFTDLPTGATFSSLSATEWKFDWIPKFSQAGSYLVNFKVADAGSLIDSRDVQIIVTSPTLADGRWGNAALPGGVSISRIFANGQTVFALPGNKTTSASGGPGYPDTSKGVYLSIDNGSSWRLVTMPGFPAAVTGKYMFAIDTVSGRVIRSSDGGLSWTVVYETAALGLAASANTLFVLTSQGVARTSDGGTNWTFVARTDNTLRPPNQDCFIARGASLFVGTNLGVFRSDNFGAVWKEVNNGLKLPGSNLQPPFAIRCMTTDGAVVYAGTFKDIDGENGSGLYRSTNNGDTWQHVTSLPLSSSGTYFDVYAKGDILLTGTIDGIARYASGISGSSGRNYLAFFGAAVFAYSLTGNEHTLFAGTPIGIYRSFDGGMNWLPASAGLGGNRMTSVTVKGAAVFAAAAVSTPVGQITTIFQSANRGAGWEIVDQGLVRSDGSRYFIPRLKIAGSTILAGSSGSDTFRGGAFQYISPESRWKLIPDVPGMNDAISVDSFIFIGCDRGIWRSGDQGQTWASVNQNLSVQSLALGGGFLFAGTTAGVYRSSDQGLSWELFNSGLSSDTRITSMAFSGNYLYVGTPAGVYRSGSSSSKWERSDEGLPGNTEVLSLIDSGGTLIGGTSAGCYIFAGQGSRWTALNTGLNSLRINSASTDGTSYFAATESGIFELGVGVQTWNEVNTNLPARVVNAVSVDGINLFAGTLDGRGVYRSINEGLAWTAAEISLKDPPYVFSVYAREANIIVGTYGNGIYYSADSGLSWKGAVINPGNLFIRAITSLGSVFFAATEGGGVYRSSDSGVTWTPVNNNLTNLTVFSLAVDGNSLYAGCDDGKIFISTDLGNSWTSLRRLPLPQGVSVDVRAIAAGNSILYVGTLGAGIFRSDDNGQSWTTSGSDLPAGLSVFTFAITGSLLFVGTGDGVFTSRDGGQNWQKVNTGLSDSVVYSLTHSNQKLFAGTRSGGAFTSQIQD